jgi:SPASM domain peptide maturase of grasp-with-spasm system
MKSLVLVANCFPVRGYKRSIICDTVRFKYEFIPNSLYDFIYKYNKRTITEIKADFKTSEEWEIIQSYLTFLEEKEFIFYTDKAELFPDVAIEWESPLHITNSIIDFDEFSDHDLKKIIEELNELYCEAIEVRDFFGMNISQIREIVDCTKNSTMRSMYLLLKYNGPYPKGFFEELIKSNRRIMSVMIHSTPEDSMPSETNDEPGGEWYNITYVKQVLTDETHCGNVSKFNFSTTMSMFMESHFFNSCLNRKVSIDKKGFIKNCPSAKSAFGHHRHNTLIDAIGNEEFRKYWSITKDQIAVCKNCEFRYICTDCRVYVEEEGDIYSKPKKCNYNPYTATWAN